MLHCALSRAQRAMLPTQTSTTHSSPTPTTAPPPTHLFVEAIIDDRPGRQASAGVFILCQGLVVATVDPGITGLRVCKPQSGR
jgi:hypothetical protein